MAVTKTDYVRALQCQKMLWLDAHEPEHKIIPPEVQQRLDEGNEFGDKAMGIFGAYKEATAYKADGRMDFAAMLERTKTWLEQGENVVCEGAFSWYGNYCAADILKKDGAGYAMYEVKNAGAPRKEFLCDMGFQRLILRKCGVNITACYLILNADKADGIQAGQVCVEHENQRYLIVDVSAQARILEREAQNKVFDFGKLKKKDAPKPIIGTGEHCETPYRCWYYEYCHNGERA